MIYAFEVDKDFKVSSWFYNIVSIKVWCHELGVKEEKLVD